MRSKTLLLYYHRINDMEHDINSLCITKERFRDQLRFLKQNYNILRYEDDWAGVADKNNIVITFDDGYMDFYDNALPIIEQERVPVTIFVTSAIMQRKMEFWWDELDTILFAGKNIPNYMTLDDEMYGCTWQTDTYSHKLNCYRTIHHAMMLMIDASKKKEWFKKLWQCRGCGRFVNHLNKTLDADFLRKIALSPYISIGAHTISHPALATMTFDEQYEEIKTSVDVVKSIIGREVNIFSYPFGSYNGDSVEACRKAGIIKAATTEGRCVGSNDSPYLIPRKNVDKSWDIFEFAAEINKTFGEV